MRARAVALFTTALIALAACAETPDPDVSAESDANGDPHPNDQSDDDSDGDGVIESVPSAAECAHLDELVPEMVDGAEPMDNADGTAAHITGDEVEAAHERFDGVGVWGREHAGDDFGGHWIDQQNNTIAVAFVDNVEDHAQAIRDEIHEGIAVVEVAASLTELEAASDAMRDELETSEDVKHTGMRMMDNRVAVSIQDPSEERIAELTEQHGENVVCFEIIAAPQPPADGVLTLAKIEGWADEELELTATEGLEVAYDEQTAQQLWDHQVPEALDEVDAEVPESFGIYGSPEDVDFDQQVVVLWSGGGACPEWLVDVSSEPDRVTVLTDSTGGPCTSVNKPYRIVAAIDRADVPTADELPVRIAATEEGEVVSYPRRSETGDREHAGPQR